MAEKHRKQPILIQLDTDPQPSSFDSVVAIDAGVGSLLSFSQVALDQVQSLVHGAIFTRGTQDLRHTAIFIGGSDVDVGDQILRRVCASFLGPLSVSVMVDANGANTTAAAAVHVANRHMNLESVRALVLAGTGPVGRRTARLLAGRGAKVRLASRSAQRAADAANKVNEFLGSDLTIPYATADLSQLRAALDDIDLVIAAGAAGIELLPAAELHDATGVKVAIDLNAVPPSGIENVKATDQAVQLGTTTVYGAVGVGITKMKIHKAAIASLFERHDLVLDAEEIFEIACRL
ncbi:MAG: bifunctional NADP-dependent methylenetetrahydromethanopterin dehydrogenase/methylenetetrahydrofolate dehydrogenase [Phycisphaeraceae bacterium]|nr:bifunctional NADP-dependent methylenetetrahydromethanopterin dehydrogenase/methylenetetrahydrofolate dehydrogenase [Phycisphaeraceae bacterium]